MFSRSDTRFWSTTVRDNDVGSTFLFRITFFYDDQSQDYSLETGNKKETLNIRQCRYILDLSLFFYGNGNPNLFLRCFAASNMVWIALNDQQKTDEDK